MNCVGGDAARHGVEQPEQPLGARRGAVSKTAWCTTSCSRTVKLKTVKPWTTASGIQTSGWVKRTSAQVQTPRTRTAAAATSRWRRAGLAVQLAQERSRGIACAQLGAERRRVLAVVVCLRQPRPRAPRDEEVPVTTITSGGGTARTLYRGRRTHAESPRPNPCAGARRPRAGVAGTSRTSPPSSVTAPLRSASRPGSGGSAWASSSVSDISENENEGEPGLRSGMVNGLLQTLPLGGVRCTPAGAGVYQARLLGPATPTSPPTSAAARFRRGGPAFGSASIPDDALRGEPSCNSTQRPVPPVLCGREPRVLRVKGESRDLGRDEPMARPSRGVELASAIRDRRRGRREPVTAARPVP